MSPLNTSPDPFDKATLLLEQAAAQLTCFSVFMQNDSDDSAMPSNEMIWISLAGIADSVRSARELLLDSLTQAKAQPEQ